MRNTFAMLPLAVAGCSIPVSTSPQQQPPAAAPSSGQLMVYVDAGGQAHVGNLYASSSDWPNVIKQWHVTSAVVRGMQGAKLSDMLKVEDELKSAGVPEVTLAQP